MGLWQIFFACGGLLACYSRILTLTLVHSLNISEQNFCLQQPFLLLIDVIVL